MTDVAGSGALFIVSTPIGNMGDFSFRGVEVLKSVHVVLAEDTRHTRHLLDHYGIATSLLAYHEHNESKLTPRIVERLRAGESFALVTDAGTPLVSDPGSRLVRAAIEAELPVVPVPGASAVLPALVASGLDTGRFTFYGFLARSGAERNRALDEITTMRHTVVLYESPNRLAATLAELDSRGNGERLAAVAREMTKRFEETRRGTVRALLTYYEKQPPRGEVVLVLGSALQVSPGDARVRARVRDLRASGLSARDTAAAVAAELGVPKRLAYRMAQENAVEESSE